MPSYELLHEEPRGRGRLTYLRYEKLKFISLSSLEKD